MLRVMIFAFLVTVLLVLPPTVWGSLAPAQAIVIAFYSFVSATVCGYLSPALWGYRVP